MLARTGQLDRVARQHVQTTRLFGVDFLPVSSRTPPVAQASPAGDRSAVVAGKAAALAELRREHDNHCPHCTKATAHTRTVFGDGNPDAEIMFIGEAPGYQEDLQGIPFVGPAGQKLNDMIKAMGLRREDVYIANVLKARPPNNETPTPEEASRCGPYLLRQIEIIQPRIIVTLGRPAVQFLLETKDSMTNLRGRWFEYRGIPVMPTFHPAFLLRQYTPENRRKVWSDLQQVIARLKEIQVAPRPT